MEPVSWYLRNTVTSDITTPDTPSGSPVEDLADTAVADPELPADDAGPHPGGRHLDDLEADVVGQRPAVDEDSPQLIDPSLP